MLTNIHKDQQLRTKLPDLKVCSFFKKKNHVIVHIHQNFQFLFARFVVVNMLGQCAEEHIGAPCSHLPMGM